MFIDTSAIVAILAEADDAPVLVAKIEGYKSQIYYSALSVFEAVMSLAKITAFSHGLGQSPIPAHMIEEAQIDVEAFLKTIAAKELPIGTGVQKQAIEAARIFGSSVSHPAGLNTAECFSYACARAYQIPLLFSGHDFTKTDIKRL